MRSLAIANLVVHAAGNDPEDVVMDFLEIYDQYYTSVRKFILALVRDEWAAEDLVQETFVRIRENSENLRDLSKMSSWVLRIAYNLCQDYFRSLKKPSLDGCATQGEGESLREDLIHKELEQREMGRCVQNHMNRLPESHRTVLVLYDVMDLGHQEIADILGIRVENVKVRLHRARKRLKAILEEECTFQRDERNVLVCEPVEKK